MKRNQIGGSFIDLEITRCRMTPNHLGGFMSEPEYLVPGNVQGASNWAVPREEALTLGILCEKHEVVRISWGTVLVCRECKREVFVSYSSDEWLKFDHRLEKVIRASHLDLARYILDGFDLEDYKNEWLTDVLVTVCAVGGRTPDEALDSFNLQPELIRQILQPTVLED